jgi:translation elongation factor EF-Tu-like GTPase
MFKMTVEDVFLIRNRGVVVTGRVETGTLRVGDTVQINGGPGVRVDAIEKFRKQLDEATAGENIGVLIRSIDRDQLNRGDVVTSSGEAPGIESANVIV